MPITDDFIANGSFGISIHDLNTSWLFMMDGYYYLWLLFLFVCYYFNLLQTRNFKEPQWLPDVLQWNFDKIWKIHQWNVCNKYNLEAMSTTGWKIWWKTGKTIIDCIEFLLFYTMAPYLLYVQYCGCLFGYFTAHCLVSVISFHQSSQIGSGVSFKLPQRHFT